jgi:hypothetical protein
MNTVSFLAIPAGIVPDQEAIVSGADASPTTTP